MIISRIMAEYKQGLIFFFIFFICNDFWTPVLAQPSRAELDSLRQNRIREARVTARNLLRKESDRLVYNVKADPDARNLSMSEMMKKVPGLQVSARDGKLVYEQTPIRSILVDDSESGIINARRQYPMSFIQSDYLSRIELVLPGSPEYRNDAPILLLRLSRPLPYGAAAELRADSDVRGNAGAGADAVSNMPLVGAAVDYGYTHANDPRRRTCTRREQFDGTTYDLKITDSYSWANSNAHHLGLDIFRPLFSNKGKISFSLFSDKTDGIRYQDTQMGTMKTVSHSDTSSPMKLNAGVRFDRSWGRNRFEMLYTFRNSESEERQILLYTQEGSPDENWRVSAHNSSKEHAFKTTLRFRDTRCKPVWSFLGEVGWRGRLYESESFYQTTVADTRRLDYSQNIFYADALYLGNTPSKKLSWSLLLKGESLSTSGQVVDYNLIPRGQLSWRQKYNRISLSASSMVRRPRMDQLNPYMDIADKDNVSTGNAALKGEKSYHGMLSYNRDLRFPHFRSLDISYSITRTDKSLERYTTVAAGNSAQTSWVNLDMRVVQTMSARLNGQVNSKIIFSLWLHWNRASYYVNEYAPSVCGFFSGLFSANALLSGYELHSSLGLRPADQLVQRTKTILEPTWEASVSRYFQKLHLGVSLTGSDLLHSATACDSYIAGDGFSQHRSVERLGRNIRLSLYWRMGRFKRPDAISIDSYDR